MSSTSRTPLALVDPVPNELGRYPVTNALGRDAYMLALKDYDRGIFPPKQAAEFIIACLSPNYPAHHRVAGACCHAPAPSEPDKNLSIHPAQALSTV